MPTRAEPVVTMDRLLSFAEAHEVAPGGRRPSCQCMKCAKCVARIRLRVTRGGRKLGWWRSERARSALRDRLSGKTWREVAEIHGYADAKSAQASVKAIRDLTDTEKEALAQVKVPRRTVTVEVVPARPQRTHAVRMAETILSATPADRLAELQARIAIELVNGYRAKASPTELGPLEALLDRVEARLALLRENGEGLTNAQRRLAVAADRQVSVKTPKSSTPVNQATREAFRRNVPRVRSEAAA